MQKTKPPLGPNLRVSSSMTSSTSINSRISGTTTKKQTAIGLLEIIETARTACLTGSSKEMGWQLSHHGQSAWPLGVLGGWFTSWTWSLGLRFTCHDVVVKVFCGRIEVDHLDRAIQYFAVLDHRGAVGALESKQHEINTRISIARRVPGKQIHVFGYFSFDIRLSL